MTTATTAHVEGFAGLPYAHQATVGQEPVTVPQETPVLVIDPSRLTPWLRRLLLDAGAMYVTLRG
jgi:hypothetical protein